ncbi:hypothetical protein ACJJTC_001938 [Scirpophaga incertulas]
MQWYTVLAFCFIALVGAQEAELPLADICDAETCQLPDCRCSSTQIPGNLQPRDTPQFVMVTFDDAINVINIETYNELLNNRKNSNGCTAGATFYVSHEYTNYQLVNELYNKGLEIALHSISHRTPQTYWKEATYETVKREFGDQIGQMAHFANIPKDSIKGVRMPFLQMTGNSTFQVISETSLEYDCSWPTVTYKNPGLWPYTLDFSSTQDCVVPPCPSAAISNSWVLPMIAWEDLNGTACAMVDSCFAVPDHSDADAWFEFISANFERHYKGNRAPFGFFIHEWYLSTYPQVKLGLAKFLDSINKIPDVFMVNSKDVIEWVKNPVPVDEYANRPCKVPAQAPCSRASCGPLSAEHTQMSYYMQVCSKCPRVYPWLDNPLGA